MESNPADMPESSFGVKDALQRFGGVSQPAIQRMGALEHGVTPSEYDYINQPITQPTKPEPKHIDRGGFGGTMKSIARGALQGLAIGGQRGGAQGIGGALAGAIQGGISPQSVENTYNETFRMPKYEHDKAVAEQDVTNREGAIDRIAKRTGYDPMTGKETPDMELHRMDRTLKGEQIKATSEGRQQTAEWHQLNVKERVRNHQATESEKQLNDFWTRFPGQPTPKELAVSAGRPFLEGYKSTGKVGSGTPHFEGGGR